MPFTVTTPLVKMRLERPAGRDKREIKNLFSAEYGQSKAEAIQNLIVDLREALQLAGAVGAAHRLDGDLALAVGADLGGRLRRSFLGLFLLLVEHGVEGLQHQEQHKGNDQEVDDRTDERGSHAGI